MTKTGGSPPFHTDDRLRTGLISIALAAQKIPIGIVWFNLRRVKSKGSWDTHLMLRGKRILVVEDEAVLAGNLRDYFRRRGSQVALASGGDAALPLAEGFAPNVLVVSDALPGMDRLGVLQALRLRFPTAIAVLLSECCEDLIAASLGARYRHRAGKALQLVGTGIAIEEAGSQPAGIAELSIPVAEILSPPPLQARI